MKQCPRNDVYAWSIDFLTRALRAGCSPPRRASLGIFVFNAVLADVYQSMTISKSNPSLPILAVQKQVHSAYRLKLCLL